jgi:hypothetical protein
MEPIQNRYRLGPRQHNGFCRAEHPPEQSRPSACIVPMSKNFGRVLIALPEERPPNPRRGTLAVELSQGSFPYLRCRP